MEPRTAAAVLDVVAQHCSSTAMVYLMHLCGVACLQRAGARQDGRSCAAPRGNTSQRARPQRDRIAQSLLGAGQPSGARQLRSAPDGEQISS
jgi:hypothetical protein